MKGSDKRVHIVQNIGESVGSLWKELQNNPTEKAFIVAAPISNTPVPVYQWIIGHAQAFNHWQTFHFLLMDEQVVQKNSSFSYLSENDQASFSRKIKELFLLPLEEQTGLFYKILKPDLTALSLFDKNLERHNGIDLLILALGEGGHYAQVMPGTSEKTGFHIAELLESYKTRHKNKGVFQHSTFQQYGMSLGPRQVLQAKQVVVIISGEQKKELAQQLFAHASFDPQFPLSIIYHPKVFDRVKIFVTPEVLPE